LVKAGFVDYSSLEEIQNDDDYYWYSKCYGYLSKEHKLTI
jgi:hypothetical protein